MKKIFLIALTIFCAGCATRPPAQSSHRVPAARVFDQQLLQPSPKRNCAITVAREPGVAGAGLNVYLDGNEFARVAASESFTAYVRPGRHTVSVRPLFNPATGRLLGLKANEKIALLIVDRDGNFQLQIRGEGWTDAMKSWWSATPTPRKKPHRVAACKASSAFEQCCCRWQAV